VRSALGLDPKNDQTIAEEKSVRPELSCKAMFASWHGYANSGRSPEQILEESYELLSTREAADDVIMRIWVEFWAGGELVEYFVVNYHLSLRASISPEETASASTELVSLDHANTGHSPSVLQNTENTGGSYAVSIGTRVRAALQSFSRMRTHRSERGERSQNNPSSVDDHSGDSVRAEGTVASGSGAVSQWTERGERK